MNGLCEQLNAAGKTCAFFYNWEELRDLSRPSSLAYSYFVSGGVYTYEKANEMVTANALSFIREEKPDFRIRLPGTYRQRRTSVWLDG